MDYSRVTLSALELQVRVSFLLIADHAAQEFLAFAGDAFIWYAAWERFLAWRTR